MTTHTSSDSGVDDLPRWLGNNDWVARKSPQSAVGQPHYAGENSWYNPDSGTSEQEIAAHVADSAADRKGALIAVVALVGMLLHFLND